MNLTTKLAIIEQLFALYDRFMEDFDLACKKDCAYCCTANVTLTTLEGYRIVSHLISSDRLDRINAIVDKAQPNRLVPRVSINRMADLCARGADPPPDNLDPGAGPCPALIDAACPLYAVRPFGCRCMVSARNCGETGFAHMDPFVLTVNNVLLQVIEHIDAQGCTGNFVDVMNYLQSEENRQLYATGRMDTAPNGLVPNQPVFVLMIPPEHRERIQPMLNQIRKLQVP